MSNECCPCCKEPLATATTVRLPCLHLLCTQCLGDMTTDDDRHCFATADEGLDCASRFQVDQVVKLQVRLNEEGEHAAKRTKTDDDESDNQLLATKRGLCEKLLAKLEKGLTNMDTHLAKLATQAADAVEAIERGCQALNERRLQLRKDALDEINTDVKAVQLLRDTLVVGRAHVQLLLASQTIEKDLFIARADTLLGTDYPLFYPKMREVVKVMFPAECTDAATFGNVSRSRDYTTVGNAKPVLEIEDAVFGQLRRLAFAPDGSFYVSDPKGHNILCFSQYGLLLPSRTIVTAELPGILSVTCDGYIWATTHTLFDEAGVYLVPPTSKICVLSTSGEQLCSLPYEWQDIGDRLRFVPLPNGNMLLTSFNEYYLNVFTSTGQPLWHSEKTTEVDIERGNVVPISGGATAVVDDKFVITYTREGGALYLYPLHPQYKMSWYSDFPCHNGMAYDSTERVFIVGDDDYNYSVRASDGSLHFKHKDVSAQGFWSFRGWCHSPDGLIYCSNESTQRLMIF